MSPQARTFRGIKNKKNKKKVTPDPQVIGPQAIGHFTHHQKHEK